MAGKLNSPLCFIIIIIIIMISTLPENFAVWLGHEERISPWRTRDQGTYKHTRECNYTYYGVNLAKRSLLPIGHPK